MKSAPIFAVMIIQFVTGNSGSNPERAYGDKFFVCQRINLATQ
jgi:hypothetical protein